MTSACEIEVPERIYQKVIELAERNGMTAEEVVRAAITRGLEVSTRTEG